METIDSIAHWLRETIAAQPWLSWAQPYLAQAPDWALLAPPALTALLIVWALFGPRGKKEKLPKARPRDPVAARAPESPRPPNAAIKFAEAANPSPVATPPPAATFEPRVTPPAAPQVASAAPTAMPTPPRAKADTAPAPTPIADDEDNRSVRVFVSSTFLDMQAERDELVTKAFPALRTKYRARGVEVFEVDLRWGITREMQERGDTLPTLLAEIDRCRPYFIGLLGDRFGWVPSPQALTDKLRADYPAIAEADGMSVTAMEIIHGVLADPDTASRACFFERDPSWDWISTLDEADRAAAAAEPDAARVRLGELKAQLRRTGARIEPYARPEEISQKVIDALDALLSARFPDAETPDAFEQSARPHRAYARERRGLHVGAEGYLRDLDDWMEAAEAPPKLITGASGGGKSTLVANWLHAWRKAHRNDIVFEHYLGASPDSADPMLLMRRLWEHLNRATGETVDPPGAKAELMDVAAALVQRLARARAIAARNGGRVLIALDGLDKLSGEQNLRWLPMAPGVRFIASSLSGEAKDAALARGFTALEVKPLNEQEREELVVRTLARWRRDLESHQIAALLQPTSQALAGSPLYLKTVLDELRVSADRARLDARLEDYRGARDMPDLFDRVLRRLEDDCEPGLVAKALPLIWASRAGLEETEIIAIAGASPLAWATLRNGLGDSLRDQAARMAFGHDYLHKAVEARYLKNDDARRAAHLAIADRFEAREPDGRLAEELPFQLRVAEAWARLEALLIDVDRFELLHTRGDTELLSYWLPLKQRGRDPEKLLCRAFEARAGGPERWSEADVDLVFEMDRFLGFVGAVSKEVADLGERLVSACTRLFGERHQKTASSLTSLSIILHNRGDLERALALKEKAREIRFDTLGPFHPNTLTAQMNVALTLMEMGQLPRAESLLHGTLLMCEDKLGPEHPLTLAILLNLAGACYGARKFDRAKELGERLLKSRSHLLGPTHPETLMAMLNLATTLGAMGKYERVIELSEFVRKSRLDIFGAKDPRTERAREMRDLAERLLRTVGSRSS